MLRLALARSDNALDLRRVLPAVEIEEGRVLDRGSAGTGNQGGDALREPVRIAVLANQEAIELVQALAGPGGRSKIVN